MPLSSYWTLGVSYASGLLGQLIVLVACVILVVRLRNVGSFLALAAKVITCAAVVVSMLTTIMMLKGNDPSQMRYLMVANQVGNLLASFAFGIGLLLVALSLPRRQKEEQP